MNAYSKTIEWSYTVQKLGSETIETGKRRIYFHLYFGDQKAVDNHATFNSLLDTLEEELLTNQRTHEHESVYKKYYDIRTTSVRGTTIIPKQGAITEIEKNYGYYALMSNDIKDPLEALAIYRLNDLAEKAFHNLKERLALRRTSVSSEQNLEGKLFVQLLALIYLSYISKTMSDQELHKTMTIHEILDELDIVECCRHPAHKIQYGEITKKQKSLYAALVHWALKPLHWYELMGIQDIYCNGIFELF